MPRSAASKGECMFNEAWLDNTKYKAWLKPHKSDVHVAVCDLCKRTVDLRSMGESALTSHACGKKHKAMALSSGLMSSGMRTSTTTIGEFFTKNSMPGVSVKDVSQHEFVKALAAFLKKTGKMKMPDWTDIVKLGRHKELAPYDIDWYYTRSASVARHLYIRSGAGVGSFTKIYGGRKRNGTRPSHFCAGSSSVARKVLQSLEGLKMIEKDPSGGRRMTREGRRDLDRIASQIAAKQKKAAAAAASAVVITTTTTTTTEWA